jgi:uncharacterized membrane protein
MRVFGHPLHPVLVAFPVALLSLTPLCDAAARLGVGQGLALVAHYLELLGLAGGTLAGLTGFVDFYRLNAPPDGALSRTALTHASCALGVLALFGVAFALRGEAGATATTGVLVLEALGAGLLTVTGWLGGHLVFGFGAGVDKTPPERHDGAS